MFQFRHDTLFIKSIHVNEITVSLKKLYIQFLREYSLKYIR